MSRVMRRAGPAYQADLSGVDVLTVPAGHKYEVTDVFMSVTGLGSDVGLVVLNDGVTAFQVAGFANLVQAETTWHPEMNAMVLEAGDVLSLVQAGYGADWTWMVTYIDMSPV